MADLAGRMNDVVTGKKRAPAEAPFEPNGRLYPHRVSLDLTDDMYEALRARAFHDRVPMVEMIRTVLAAWCHKEGIAS